MRRFFFSAILAMVLALACCTTVVKPAPSDFDHTTVIDAAPSFDTINSRGG
jgi:hypothetical protein